LKERGLVKLTAEEAMKFEPVRVSVVVALPTGVEVGLIEVSTGTGLLVTVKVELAEVPPPGVGFVTVIVAVPAETIFAAGTVAVSWVAET
jgi:hypothetical protein